MKTKLSNKFLFWTLLISIFLLAACSSEPSVESEPTIPPPTEVPTNIQENENPTLEPTALVVIIPSATTQPTPTETATLDLSVSFSNEVLPIIENRCINCHGGDRIEEGLNLTSFTGVMAGSINGLIIIPGDAENSLFVEMVASQKMPKRGAKLTPAQVQIFRDWVNQGALDN
jgi:hypothetical protein